MVNIYISNKFMNIDPEGHPINPKEGKSVEELNMTPSSKIAAFCQVIDLFPIPIEIFTPDGTTIFVNRVFLEEYNISGPDQIIGRYNLLKDPVVNDELGLREYVRRAFEGETLSASDVKVPFDDMSSRYNAKSEEFDIDALYRDIISFPIWKEDKDIAYVVNIFITTRLYLTRSDITQAKEYIEDHLTEEFDLDRIAQTLHLSRYHLSRLFKKYTGSTPYSYYQDRRVQKLKEALCDERLSVTEAFAACGTDYGGSLARAFQEKVGMSPTAYRRKLREACESNGNGSEESSLPASDAVTEEQLFAAVQCLPLPIMIFSTDGSTVFVNPIVLEMWNISDAAQMVGVYNLKKDTVVNERLALNDYVRRTFAGEIVLVPDVRVPLEDFSRWYRAQSDNYDVVSMYTDILNFPIHTIDGRITHIVSVFLITRTYRGFFKIAGAKEYIENRWREAFDAEQTARAVGLSRYQLAHLFKQHTGISPFSFYQEIKVRKLKEALCDKNLSIAEAFASCGLTYHGNFAKIFKEKVGLTPSEYRKTVK